VLKEFGIKLPALYITTASAYSGNPSSRCPKAVGINKPASAIVAYVTLIMKAAKSGNNPIVDQSLLVRPMNRPSGGGGCC
jgi:hypothetical protein